MCANANSTFARCAAQSRRGIASAMVQRPVWRTSKAVLEHGELADYYLAHSAVQTFAAGSAGRLRPSYEKALALTQKGTGAPIPARADSAAKIKTSTTCRIPLRPFDYMVKAGQPPARKFSRVIRYAKKWSGPAQQRTRNIPCPVPSKRVYKSSGPDVGSAQHSEKTMRFMMIMFPKSYENAKPGTVPDLKDIEVMRIYNEQLQKAGVLLALDGLTPPSTMSARVTFKSGKSKVTDGPFTEAREVVGGYWVIQVKSREEALEWASRIPGKDNEMVEVRRLMEITDFPADVQEKFAKFEQQIAEGSE